MLSKFFVSAALAAGVLAAPAVQVVDDVVAVTVTVTAGTPGATPPPAPAPAPAPPAPAAPAPASSNNGGGFLEGSAPAPATTPVVVSTPAPSSSSSDSPSSGGGSPTSGGVPLLDTVNYWRQKYSLNNLEWDDDLANQATQVGQNGGGVNEVHQLIAGLDMGQVITPGQSNSVPSDQQGQTPFQVAYAAWLCEVPSDPQLSAGENNGVAMCSLVQDILHMVYTDTGHHDIIVTPSWNKVGCGWAANPSADPATSTYQGLWTCNYSE